MDDAGHFSLYCELTSDIRTEFPTEVHQKTDIDVCAEKNVLLRNLYDRKCLRITAKYLDVRRNYLYQCQGEE